MLKTIPFSFTADLLHLLMSMGHGEEILFADANYPTLTSGNSRTVKLTLPVTRIDALLVDVLRFFPLDYAVEKPAAVMEKAVDSGIFEAYDKIITAHEGAGKIELVERFAFYKRAEGVAGIVLTSDVTACANLILKKGVVR